MKYCFRCGKTFSTKSNLNQHLRNKTQCATKYLNIDRNLIIDTYDTYEQSFFSVVDNKKVTKTNNENENLSTISNISNEIEVTQNKHSYICEH